MLNRLIVKMHRQVLLRGFDDVAKIVSKIKLLEDAVQKIDALLGKTSHVDVITEAVKLRSILIKQIELATQIVDERRKILAEVSAHLEIEDIMSRLKT